MEKKKQLTMPSAGILGAGILGAGRILHPELSGPVVLKDYDKKPEDEDKPDDKKRPSNDGWKPLDTIKFDDKSVKVYHVDTRDFCVKKSTEHKVEHDLSKTRKYPHQYFHTAEEVQALLNRYYTETGGKKDWRHFTLQGVYRSEGWDMKYIRIYRYQQGLVVCNQYNFIFNKRDLAQPVLMRGQ